MVNSNEAGWTVPVVDRVVPMGPVEVAEPPVPATHAAAQRLRAVASLGCIGSGPSKTVLLAEDEEMFREILSEVLKTAGYQVLAAKHGPEAMAIATEHSGRIDLLVTDIVMPGMSGCEAAARIRSKRAGLPVLYISGYANDEAVLADRLGSRVRFLQKPFRVEVFLDRVQELLVGI